MLATSLAEIDSPMDLSFEDNAQDFDLNDNVYSDHDTNEEEDDADIVFDNKIPDDFNLETDLQDVELPPEVSDYLQTLSSETRKLEEELKECDGLLSYSVSKPHVSSALVLYDDNKEIEEAAAEMGMSVEDFKRKVLDDLQKDEFNEEEVDKEYEEFLQLQREFAELRAGGAEEKTDISAKLLALEGPTNDDTEAAEPLPIHALENGEQGPEAESDETLQQAPDESTALVKYEDSTDTIDNVAEGDQISLHSTALTSMRDFILEQLRRGEAWYEEKRQHLVESIEAVRHEEEREMLRDEERRKRVEEKVDEEREVLRQRREENDARLEVELRERQEQTSEELSYHQVEIDRLSEALAEERHKFEMSQKEWQEKLAETQGKAALKIQKVYRGVRARRRLSRELSELAELRELRAQERHTLRVMELEYEIKLKEDEAQKTKEEKEKKAVEEQRKLEEEERQRGEEQKKKEEEERIAEEIRKEKEKRDEEERLAEIKRKKEEEEQQKVEERKRKEEVKRQKEEEKRLKEEEKKRQKEEEKRKKEEEKKRKEEEKKKKEEEKKKKEEEKKKNDEEKKLKEQEEKRKQKEEAEGKKDPISQKEDVKSVQSNGITENGLESTDGTKIYEKFVSQNVASSETDKSESLVNITNERAAEVTTEHFTSSSSSVHNTVSSQMQSQSTTLPTADTAAASNSLTEVKKSSLSEATAEQVDTPAVAKVETHSSAVTSKPSELPSATAAAVSTAKTEPTTATASMVGTTTAASKSVLSTPRSTSPQPLLQPQPPAQAREPSPPKPSPAELQRLAWMKSCVPWSKVSNEPWKLSQAAAKVHKKPASAKKLPAVAESVVLAAAHAETLRQVSSVNLCDLPGCSLSTLGQCWSLRYLTVTHCGLLCLDGLSQCRHLLYINAEHNHLEYLDLKDLGSLQVARLAHNNLASVHGLEGCINLRWLDLSHNSITRIGSGLSPLRRLHTVDLSHNQLVSSAGLELAVTVQRLLLDHNYLQAVKGLEKMCLLMEISVAGNNLLQIPELKNQVLLQRLNVDENSIKSLEGLASSWLPLLHTLSCSKNLLESCQGVESLVMLQELDVSSNQISEMDSLTPHLAGKQHLFRLRVEGNPLVDVCGQEYSTTLSSLIPSLKSLDGQPVKHEGVVESITARDEGVWDNADFWHSCSAQIGLHTQLNTEFESHIQSLLSNKSSTGETLCGTFFSFCDTSFKMASEHRSAHEYGDISVSSGSVDHSSAGQTNSRLSATGGVTTPDQSVANPGDLVLDKKALFDQAVSGQVKDASSGQVSARSSLATSITSPVVSARRYKQGRQSVSDEQQSSPRHTSSQLTAARPGLAGDKPVSSSHNLKQGQAKASATGASKTSRELSGRKNASTPGSTTESDSDSDVADGGSARGFGAYSHVPHPPLAPPAAFYVNEKDKFEMALNSAGGVNKPSNPPVQKPVQTHPFANGSQHFLSEKERFEMALKNPPDSRGKNGLETATQSTTAHPRPSDAKDKFMAALQGTSSNGPAHQQRHGVLPVGVPANVVGSQIADNYTGHEDDLDLAALGLDGDLDLDGLDFDIDKYLDMGELDEFLEKGWRPENSPQIPQSSYPVLGKINSTGDPAAVPFSSVSNVNGNLSSRPPPGAPHQAWQNSPSAELRGRPLQSPSLSRPSGVAPLPLQPSPSPSSVASAAETLGGGTVKSRKDELADEWGFKDSRTAEMMMARAKKMKWNAERKKKLNKLDPQQRLHLFRKLEESGKVQSVRPPPAKVLPRKEYFQAREEEVQRQHLERRVEEQTRVHRTFEWLHTQVGDHPVASSRINAGQVPVYSTNDAASGRQQLFRPGSDNRKWSPGSDHMDSASQSGSRPGQGRRYSIGDSQHPGQTPSLPPIQVGSAPSSQKGERISFRDAPVERSGGWGGGKRRGQQHK